MLIAIRFGDNDFHKTFMGLMETLNNVVNTRQKNGEDLPEDKERLLEIVNELTYGMYLAFQKRDSSPAGNKLRSYLQVRPYQLFLGEEVEAAVIKEMESPDGSFFYLNTETGQVITV